MSEDAYLKFIEETGLKISRSTFYRIKADMLRGSSNRLTRLLELDASQEERASVPKATYYDRRKVGTRPFLGFDGEGRTLEGNHRYVLLAASNGKHVYNENRLTTEECLDFLLESKDQKAIRIFYSFGYDVQQILVDLPDRKLVQLMHGANVWWHGYRLQYLPGKIFVVNNIRFYDIFNYWQKSFIRAVQESLGDNEVSQSLIKGKESRSEFSEWGLDEILSYTNEELELLVKLAEHLREVFKRADINLGTAYYGPGSIANYWFKKYKINPPKIDDPVLKDVMERAYYGGRFEAFNLGKVSPVYECDINSAYPAVIQSLPYLDGWRHTEAKYFDRTPPTWSVWHVRWQLSSGESIGPFPSRDRHGLISYPRTGIGWYYKPELDAAIEVYGRSSFDILEGYIPTVIQGRPFEWVGSVYNNRLELKKRNDPAQWGLKLGLNSLYGKTAQRVGSAKYFSLAWAGYITSATRAKLLLATKGRQESIISFATDAVYFDKDPNLVSGNGLGDWSVKRWDRGYFIQSGVYRLELENSHKDAYRGFAVKNGIQDILDQIKENPLKYPYLYQIKFVGHLEAIKCPKKLGPHRLSFIAVRKKLEPFRTTKRKVEDSDVFNFVIGVDYDPTRSIDWIAQGDQMGAYWDHSVLLSKTVHTNILENHNDHSSLLLTEAIGDLEESYPFKRITPRNEDILDSGSDDISEERVGGANGLIPISKITSLPVVDEEDIIKESISNGDTR